MELSPGFKDFVSAYKYFYGIQRWDGTYTGEQLE
jgi:hypothetical protein